MSSEQFTLPSDPEELVALFATMQERAVAAEKALEEERAAHEVTQQKLKIARDTIKLTALQIEKLKVQLAKLRRMKFGQSSERMTELADQLELSLEDLEAEQSFAETQLSVDPTKPAKEKRKPKRLLLPDHLPREEVIHAAPDSDCCSACGGGMSKLGEDVSEILEYIPGRFRVIRNVRPKMSCKSCNAISQASAVSAPIPRGKAGPELLAHVAISKFLDHLPLYRQASIYAREGVQLSRSTLADWVGQVSWLLQPLVEKIEHHVLTSVKLHADDTPVPVLAPGTGKTTTGRLWIYLRDNRRWSPSDKPAALYKYSPDRKGERPQRHLERFAGFLQADAYAGFARLYVPDREPGTITPVACWAHARRKLEEVHKAAPNVMTAQGLKLIQLLYDVERDIAPEPASERRKARKLSKLRALDFFAWADDVLSKISARSALAEALRYAIKLKPQLLIYTEDGRLEIDNNLAENSLRGIAVGRKNWLFAGADCGGERAATFYTLLETAKLNGVNPQTWLADVLERIGQGYPINRIDDLLPWNWAKLTSASI